MQSIENSPAVVSNFTVNSAGASSVALAGSFMASWVDAGNGPLALATAAGLVADPVVAAPVLAPVAAGSGLGGLVVPESQAASVKVAATMVIAAIAFRSEHVR